MENNKDQKGFSYTYSAREQEELRNIREKYIPPAQRESKMEQLRRLDASVAQKATNASLTIGIIGALIMGSGMSLAMTDLWELLGIYHGFAVLAGIIIGVIGIMLVCIAYPVYNRILAKERKKIAPEILRLTDELMK